MRFPLLVTISANTSWYLYNFRASTIRAFVDAGYRVICLSPPDAYSNRLTELGCEWRPLPMDNASTNPAKDIALLYRFRKLYRELRPAVAFHFTIKNNVYGTWAARSLGIPSVNNVSGLGTAFIRQGFLASVVRSLYKTSQPLAYRVFCQNLEDFELLVSRRLVPSSRLKLLPGSGVDLMRYHPNLRIPRPDGSPFRLLYAGRMLADKGLNELIEAIGRINDGAVRVELSLCGFAGAENVSAIQESTLQDWAQRPGVRWIGPSDNMPDDYADADAVVLPSYREGMPRSLLEAAAMGLPVVTTDVPGCRHIVTHGVNGLLCEARSATSLQAAIEQMISLSDDERSVMGAAGRSRVEAEFDEKIVVEAALKVVREIVGIGQ